LPFIKAKAIEQVGLSEAEDSKRHASFAALRRIRFLDSSQSLNCVSPLFTILSASCNAWACHAGRFKTIIVLREINPKRLHRAQFFVARHPLQRKGHRHE
jgi:hypothetical protein